LKLSRNFQFPSIPGISLPQCYNTTCRAPTRLLVGINNVWYECPYEGGSVSPLDFGGAITCIPNAADRVCLDASVDDGWPTIDEIVPPVVASGQNITVIGSNFLQTNQMTVNLVKGDIVVCSDVNVENDTALNCTVGDSSAFSTLTDIIDSFTGAVTVSIVVADAKGRTAYLQNGVAVQTNTGLQFAGFIEKYPGWFAALIVVAVAILVAVVVIIFKVIGYDPFESYQTW